MREDAIRPLGFDSEEERAWFAHRQMIPARLRRSRRCAISTPCRLTLLVDAVALQDKAAFARANGVGPKLAARLAQELAAKQGPKGFLSLAAAQAAREASPGSPAGQGARAEAVSALVNLGIDSKQRRPRGCLSRQAISPPTPQRQN